MTSQLEKAFLLLEDLCGEGMYDIREKLRIILSLNRVGKNKLSNM